MKFDQADSKHLHIAPPACINPVSCARHCRELLVMVMRKHQRYFPVYDSGDELQPVFVTVANGPIVKDLVRVRSSLL